MISPDEMPAWFALPAIVTMWAVWFGICWADSRQRVERLYAERNRLIAARASGFDRGRPMTREAVVVGGISSQAGLASFGCMSVRRDIYSAESISRSRARASAFRRMAEREADDRARDDFLAAAADIDRYADQREQFANQQNGSGRSARMAT